MMEENYLGWESIFWEFSRQDWPAYNFMVPSYGFVDKDKQKLVVLLIMLKEVSANILNQDWFINTWLDGESMV